MSLNIFRPTQSPQLVFLLTRFPHRFLIWLLLTTSYFQIIRCSLLILKCFGCTCFVRDIHPQVSKLDPKSLKCIFGGYSRVQKGYRCFCPTLRRYFMFIDVAFFETTPFSLPSTVPSQGEEEDFLVYTLTSPIVSPEPASVPAQVKPPIPQVYTRRHPPPPPPPQNLEPSTSCFDIRSSSQ